MKVFQMFKTGHLLKQWKYIVILLSVLLLYIQIYMIHGDDDLDEMTVGGGVMEEDILDDEDTSKFYKYNTIDHFYKSSMQNENTFPHNHHHMHQWQPHTRESNISNLLRQTHSDIMISQDLTNLPNAPDINQLFSNTPKHQESAAYSGNTQNSNYYSGNMIQSVEPIRIRSRSEGMIPSISMNSISHNSITSNHPLLTTHTNPNSMSSNNYVQNTQNTDAPVHHNMPPFSTNMMNQNAILNAITTSSNNNMSSNNNSINKNIISTSQNLSSSNMMYPLMGGNTSQEEAGYIVPRFPTKYHILPAFNPPPQCNMHLCISDLTDGKVDALKQGGLQISYNMYQQKLKFYTFGKPKYSTRNVLKFPYWVYKKIFTRVQEYTSMVLVPSGCVVYPQDKNIMHTVESLKSSTITGGTLHLSAEEYALYTPVDIPPPVDLSEYGIQYGKQDFKMVGPCIMSGHFPVAPHQIVVSSSILNASIIIQTPQGTEVIQATYPEVCIPLFFNRIAAWVLPITDGSTVLIATSPPIVVGDRQEQWKLVPIVTEEIMKSHNYVTSTV